MNLLNTLSLVALTMTSPALTAEIVSTNNERTDLAVTVYNQDLALVRDTRQVTLPTGVQTLAFKDVSARIRPETLSLNGRGLTLLEQNFEYDLINLNALIDKNIGETVTFVSTNNNGDKTIQTGKILANNDQPIIEIDGVISTLPQNTQIVFDTLPKNLRDRPTMTLLVDSQTEAEQTLGMTYLTGGLNWKADYVASLLDDDTLSLSGWITLNNQSGTTFNNAKLQLVAGDVNTVRDEMMHRAVPMMAKAKAEMSDVAEESLFEYHLYTLPRKTTIKHNQQKQVALLSANTVGYTKRYIAETFTLHHAYRHTDKSKHAVNTFVEFTNDKESGLGLPLPKGVIRTYQNDSKGNAQFIGEDQIDHTPENERVKLRLGEAFDLTAHRKQTNYKDYGKTAEMAYEITLKNAKPTAVKIELPQRFAQNWTIKQSSHDWQKTDSSTATWTLDVPAKGETVLTYEVNITH